jgi:hypothetical protein
MAQETEATFTFVPETVILVDPIGAGKQPIGPLLHVPIQWPAPADAVFVTLPAVAMHLYSRTWAMAH